MDKIRPWLYIGNYADSLDHVLLKSHGIGAMLQLAELIQYPQLRFLYLPVKDGCPVKPELLRRGVDFVHDAYERDLRVLVACAAGINRSATFATAVLVEIEGLGLLEALAAVKKHHPEAMPHPALWASLCAYYQERIVYRALYDLEDLY